MLNAITSRFDETQLIYYAIKTIYGTASRVVKHWLWNINHSSVILFSTDTKIVYIYHTKNLKMA